MMRALALWLLPLTCVAACATLLGLRDQPQGAFPHRAHVLKGVNCATCHKQVAQSHARSELDLPGHRAASAATPSPTTRAPALAATDGRRTARE